MEETEFIGADATAGYPHLGPHGYPHMQTGIRGEDNMETPLLVYYVPVIGEVWFWESYPFTAVSEIKAEER